MNTNVDRGPAPRRSPLMLGICLALAVPAALAQQAPPAAPAPADKPASAPTDLDRLVVTGSRIRRAGFDTLEPATVVTKDYIANRGLTNVADALNEIPGFGLGITPEGNQAGFGTGVNFVNRFGLGSARTLTLVNGRRFVSSAPTTLFGPAAPGLQVDLNAIPTAMVERIENIAIGGAPTYGSDAIAGVVNVILRKDYEGVEFGTSYGVTEQGDNQRYNFWALVGAGFDEGRGNITFSFTYDDQKGVLQKDRDYFRTGYFNATNPLASTMAAVFPGRQAATDGRYNPNIPYNTGANDGIPNGVMIRDRRIWTTPFGGLLSPTSGPFRAGSGNLRPNGFGPNRDVVLAFDRSGNVVPYNPGTTFSATDASGGDGLSLVESGQITSDLKRMSINTTARWGLTDNIDVFMEGSFYSAESTELADQWVYNAPLFGGLSGMITFPTSYAGLSDQARTTLQGLGVGAFNLSRASRDLVTNNGSGTTELGRIVVGLEGNFELANRVFYWEASANYGRSDSRSHGTALVQQNFINALNVVRNAQGQLVCTPTPIADLFIPDANGRNGNTPVADPNCVPLDLFGEGRPSAAARNYVTTPTSAQALQEQQVFNVNISSTLLEMWGGPLQYNVGYEHRKESGLFDPGQFLTAGLGRSVAITPLQGEYSTNEWFGEFVLPLVNPEKNFIGLRKLDVIGKYRQVDSSINGKFDTYTYGLQWKPFDDLEVRGNFTRSLRSPSITEAFLPRATSFQFVTNDPCDTRFIAGGNRPATRAANCQAFLNYYGLTNFTSNANGASIQGVSSGNPNLRNESSDSYSYGFTWAPSFLEGLTVTADYYKIEITDVIAQLTAQDMAAACFDSTAFNTADIPNANAFCSLITRNAPGTAQPGQATTFNGQFVNGKFYNMEAYSTEIAYRFETERFGRFALGMTGYFPRELTLDTTGVSPDPAVGEIGNSKRQYQFSGAWEKGAWGLNMAANYLSSAEFNVLNTPETRDILKIDSYWLFNAGARYRFNDHATVRLAVSNLFDKDPPAFAQTSANLFSTYDILGRRYNLSFEWKF
ncbi:Outer membrane cobalamin receptor protein [Lysobacter sp. yr284]|uniref:TonB-dependent receptor domain-containing protein n=1 Tax=Lysobacter sp. yr284 TaxID=1761791 RepID=UPI00089D4CA6|nr:TonB-dependent receptor [Lysobacter sp. yr284]SDZ31600.1 Outer membrane cobalamin receptor protein [Lysobacter sp. yr284]